MCTRGQLSVNHQAQLNVCMCIEHRPHAPHQPQQEPTRHRAAVTRPCHIFQKDEIAEDVYLDESHRLSRLNGGCPLHTAPGKVVIARTISEPPLP
jgi:hypothetical protein